MPNFLMTYSCFMVLRPSSWPDAVVTNQGKAVCIFTDEDLAERYCGAKRQAIRERTGRDVREFRVARFRHAKHLHASLSKNAAALAEKGVEFVAIDPSTEKRTLRIALSKFLRDLEQDRLE